MYPNRPIVRTNLIGAPALQAPSINRLGLSPNALQLQLQAEEEKKKQQNDKWQGLLGLAGPALLSMLF